MAKRRYVMGDKGRRDKEKGQKQKLKKKDQAIKRALEKQPTKAPERNPPVRSNARAGTESRRPVDGTERGPINMI